MQNGVNIFVSGSPCKVTPNLTENVQSCSAGTEGCCVYNGSDQVTRIEKGSEVLPIAQESLESLTDEAEVSVVAQQGTKTVAVWSFEGGGDA